MALKYPTVLVHGIAMRDKGKVIFPYIKKINGENDGLVSECSV